MASTTKKGSRKTKAKPRGAVAKKSQPKQAQNIQALQRALDESLAREAAASEILGMIASSPADLQSVLDGIAERAARLCDAEDAAIFRLDGNFLRLVAHFGPIPTAGTVGVGRVLDRGTPAGRAIIDGQTIHVHDLRAADTEFPEAKARGIAMGLRTVLDLFEEQARMKATLVEDLGVGLGIRVSVELTEPGALPRWDHKAKRVRDERTEVPF